MGGCRVRCLRAAKSRGLNQGWVLMSFTPPARQPYRLLRSTWQGAHGWRQLSTGAHNVCRCGGGRAGGASWGAAADTGGLSSAPASKRLPACLPACLPPSNPGTPPDLQQLAHEVPRRHREVGGEGEGALQDLLVGGQRVVVIEGRVSRHHLVHQHTQSPPVHRLAMALQGKQWGKGRGGEEAGGGGSGGGQWGSQPPKASPACPA
jgi:hypothetical protein